MPGPWRPANNGTGKRIWFLVREASEVLDRYHWDSRGPIEGDLVRYGSHDAAAKAANRLNAL